jgi:glycosyltransferase involved in cell wall biosynthesis
MRSAPSSTPSAWPIAGGRVSVALVVGTLAHAGVARHVTALVRALGAGRHRVHVYALAEPSEPAASGLATLGVPLCVLPRRRSWEPARVLALARVLKRDGIDLVHAILPAGAAYGSLAARLAGIPIVIVSTRAGEPRADGATRALLRRVYRHATAVVANTRAQAECFAHEAAMPLGRVRVVYDGVDLARSAPPGVLDGLRDRVWHRPLVIGGTGPEDTGRALFAATAARVAARHPEAQFVWLRDGAAAAADVAAPSPVPITVVPVADDPHPVLRQLAMLCLAGAPDCPSLDLVPAALAAARPVVAAQVPGIDELITDGATGAVVPCGDAEALAGAALDLLENRGRLRTAGHAARAYAERALDAAAMGRATAALYEASLLGQLTPPTVTADGRPHPQPR